MTKTSLPTDSAEAARCLDHLRRLDLAPDQVAERVAALRPAIEAGDGATMLAALDQARAWWDAYGEACRIMGEGKTADHLTDGWCDLMEMVARAPASSLPALRAKAYLSRWKAEEDHGMAVWDGALARTLDDGLAALTQAPTRQGQKEPRDLAALAGEASLIARWLAQWQSAWPRERGGFPEELHMMADGAQSLAEALAGFAVAQGQHHG